VDTIHRITDGCDPKIKNALISEGVNADLIDKCIKKCAVPVHEAHMPLRDAIDYVHYLIYSAIKLHRYSVGMPDVGGPIEIAAITADRGFRWIVHKPLDESIGITRLQHLA